MPVKPSDKEEVTRYYDLFTMQRRKEAEEAKLAKLNAEEQQKLKDLHYMHCPKCGHNLIEIDYKGIEVDKCAKCEGVWLDAGELEQISHLEKGLLDSWFKAFRIQPKK